MYTTPTDFKQTFLTPLDLEWINGEIWRLTKPLVFQLDTNSYVVVPDGFVTDFASIPRGLWNLLPPTGPYGEAAVVHDYLYQHRIVSMAVNNEYVEAYKTTRSEADSILKDAMKATKVNGLKLRIVYAGVRVGGWHAWNVSREKEKNQLCMTNN